MDEDSFDEVEARIRRLSAEQRAEREASARTTAAAQAAVAARARAIYAAAQSVVAQLIAGKHPPAVFVERRRVYSLFRTVMEGWTFRVREMRGGSSSGFSGQEVHFRGVTHGYILCHDGSFRFFQAQRLADGRYLGTPKAVNPNDLDVFERGLAELIDTYSLNLSEPSSSS